ncbi:preprotein translocase subunit YajC [Bacteroidales bacterium OttesenSCG-928-I14]|nr:preprotein translocase subunit YajC [Bacteroidales bacterium OttesenSCG-928-I14]
MNLLTILLQDPAAPAPGGMMGGAGGWIMIIALFAIMYFFMIRPQQKKQKEINKMREALKPGDQVVTSGGVYGTLKNINDTTYTIEIAKDTQIKVDKASVFAAINDTTANK